MTRQSLKDILAGLDILAWYVFFRSPGERATSAQDFHRGSTGARETWKLEVGS